jgi:hypothetical protein
MIVPPGVKIQIKEGNWRGQFVVKDITTTKDDKTSFIYEKTLSEEIRNVAKPWQDQRMSRPKFKAFYERLYNIFIERRFHNKKWSEEQIKSAIQTNVTEVSQFNIDFRKRVLPQAEMLDYLDAGDWKNKPFSQDDDKIYMIRYEMDDVPLIWIVISVNEKRGVVRLHVWSKSLVAYFLDLLGIREDIHQYTNFGPFCLSHVLSLLGPSFHTLYYTPFQLPQKDSEKITPNAIKKTMKTPREPLDAPDQSEDDIANSLYEEYFFTIDDDMRNAYKTMDVRISNIKMCIQCDMKVGTHYAQEFGKDTPFCGKECLTMFLKLY